MPTDAASSPNVGVIPYECNPGGKCNAEDPRSKFGDEYELLCAWVAKPRSVPAFADPRSLERQSYTLLVAESREGQV